MSIVYDLEAWNVLQGAAPMPPGKKWCTVIGKPDEEGIPVICVGLKPIRPKVEPYIHLKVFGVFMALIGVCSVLRGGV